MFLYYKYNVRVQLLLKYPAKKIKDLMQSVLKKVLFEANIDDLKSNYYIYIYNIAILIRLIANKFLYVKELIKNYNVNKIYFGVNLKGSHMYQF